MKILRYSIFILISVAFFLMTDAIDCQAYSAPNGQDYDYYYEHVYTCYEKYEVKIWTDWKLARIASKSWVCYYDVSWSDPLMLFNCYDDPSSGLYVTMTRNGQPISTFRANLINQGDVNNYHFVSSTIPFFEDEESAISYLTSEDPGDIQYEYDAGIGYLTGIAERSSILDIVDHESVKFPWSSTNVDDRIFKFGWASSTSTGIDLHYGSKDGLIEYKDLKIQAVLRLRGYYINFMTGSKTGLLPEENNIYEFPLIQPYDPYSLSFNFDNLDSWFADFLAEIDENAKLLEKPLMYGDLYLRVVGSTISRVNDPVYPVAGPWTCLQFTVISQLGDADNDIFIAGGTFDEEGAFIPDSSSPFGSGQEIQIGTGSGFSESDASNNIVQPNSDLFFDNLSDLFKQVDKLPTIIGSLFSFLPSWCLGLFATSFGLAVVLLIWKVAT